MMKLKQILAFALLALLLGACSEPAERPRSAKLPPLQVRTQTLALSDAISQVEVAGTLKAVEHAMISARVSGELVKLPVRVGSKVRQGDLLAQLRADEIAAKVRQVETQLAQVQRNLEREEKLLKAEASTAERVRTLREQVQLSEAGYREAKALLDYTLVRAPFDATVTRKLVEVGDLAAPGSPLLQLENSAALEVLLEVPEAQVSRLAVGRKLPVTIPAAGLELSAEVREISPTVDPATRTARVKLDLPDNPALRSGQFARIGLPARAAQTLLIDADALHQNGQMEQVYVAEKGRSVLRLVRSGMRHGGQVEILSGLRAGDEVIVSAAGRLHEGQPLQIVETEPAQ